MTSLDRANQGKIQFSTGLCKRHDCLSWMKVKSSQEKEPLSQSLLLLHIRQRFSRLELSFMYFHDEVIVLATELLSPLLLLLPSLLIFTSSPLHHSYQRVSSSWQPCQTASLSFSGTKKEARKIMKHFFNVHFAPLSTASGGRRTREKPWKMQSKSSKCMWQDSICGNGIEVRWWCGTWRCTPKAWITASATWSRRIRGLCEQRKTETLVRDVPLDLFLLARPNQFLGCKVSPDFFFLLQALP